MLPAVVELQAESDHRSEVGVRGAGSVYKHHVRGQFLPSRFSFGPLLFTSSTVPQAIMLSTRECVRFSVRAAQYIKIQLSSQYGLVL